MALCFWLGVAAMLLLRVIFGPGTRSDRDTVSDSPSARYQLAVTYFDPGAMSTALQSFRLRQSADGPQVALLELKASPAVAAIVPDWRGDTVTLSGIPASSLRRTYTLAQRIVLPNPHRSVEAQIHRCPSATLMRPQLRWEAWAVSTEPGKEGRRMLISLAYDEAAPPRLRQADAATAVIDRFRIADVLDWQQGRGEGFVPTDFLFLDDLGVERRLP